MPAVSRPHFWLLCLLALSLAGQARAEEPTTAEVDADAGVAAAGAPGEIEEPHGSLGIVLHTAPPAPPWLSEALEDTIMRELGHYERLTPVSPTPATIACALDSACTVTAYAQAGADAVFIGSVALHELDWALYEAATGRPVDSGRIELPRQASLIALKQATLRTFAPLLMHGGMFDRRPVPPLEATTPEASDSRATRTGMLLASLALFLFAPFFLGVFAPRGRALLASSRVMWAAGATTLGLSVLSLLAWHEVVPMDALTQLSGPPASVGATLCGIAWGVVAWKVATFIVPPLSGFERATHRDLPRLVRYAVYAALQRSLLVMVAALPFVLWLVALDSVWELPLSALVMGVAPAVALLASLTVATWVAAMTPWLDDAYVAGDATIDNAWHHQIHRYFMGYVRRYGLDLDPELISRILFLPGRGEVVMSYGGAGAPARIVVNTALLRFMSGDREPPPQASDAVLPDWSMGLALPAPIPKDDYGDRLKRIFKSPVPSARSWETAARSNNRTQLGQAASLLGYVVPAPPSELAPLISDDSGDLNVVRELLAEHYPWVARNPGEEDDDADPTHLDLLFGVLMLEVGAVMRRDLAFQTPVLALRCLFDEISPSLGAGVEQLGRGFRPLFLHHTRRLALAFTALHSAHHHLIQYLYMRLTEDPKYLTARATEERLLRASVRMLNFIKEQDPADTDANRQLQEHAAALSLFVVKHTPTERELTVRRSIFFAIGSLLLVWFGVSVKQSSDYHAVYLGRLPLPAPQVPEVPSPPPSDGLSPPPGDGLSPPPGDGLSPTTDDGSSPPAGDGPSPPASAGPLPPASAGSSPSATDGTSPTKPGTVTKDHGQ